MKFFRTDSPLPIDALLPEILESLRRHPNLVLVAPPGAGKTTRVPLCLIKENLVDGQVVMLQPRRIAARAAAQRLADEGAWKLGEEVGYQIRFENRTSARTRLRVVTEGILTRQLQADSALTGVSVVILDEFHERSLHTDLAIALLRELQQGLREDLRIIVMSATLEAAPVARFLGDCPILESQGRAHPVQISYQPRKAVWSDTRDLDRDLLASVDSLTREASDDGGHVLAFLPGTAEIRRCESTLAPWAIQHGFRVLPLHGSLTAEDQDRALKPIANTRKLILATNIAETSLTIDGVSAVIDSGLARTLRCDPKFGLERLELSRISAASATQRAGRAGRQRPGRAIRLWSKHEDLRPSETPEIQRVDLTSAVLTLADWGVSDPMSFGWFSPPSRPQLEFARELLQRLQAVDTRGAITAVGRRLLALPTHPRFARVLAAARAAGTDADVRLCATAAALLGERDIFTRFARATQAHESDVELRIEALEKAERLRFDRSLRDDGIDPNIARQAVNTRDQLLRQAERLPQDGNGVPALPEDLSEWLLLGFPDRVTRRRLAGDTRGVMVGGRGVQLDPASSVHEASLFLSLDPQETRREGALAAHVNIAAAIDESALSRLIPGSVAERIHSVFDEERGAVTATRVRSYWDLPLAEPAAVPVNAAEASLLLCAWLERDPRAFFESHERASLWLRRVTFLKKWMPEAPLPNIDNIWLAEVLRDLCEGAQNLAQVRARDVLGALEGRLAYREKQLLDSEAPLSLEVPSGSLIRLDYAAGPSTEEPGPVTLSVRLQEVFGWMETPRLAGGRAPVLMELLSPGFKPVQITNDLASFWARGYAEVRKELRARYPKHSWPEDPYAAQAVAKGRHRNR